MNGDAAAMKILELIVGSMRFLPGSSAYIEELLFKNDLILQLFLGLRG
jgi:hypothetical protein